MAKFEDFILKSLEFRRSEIIDNIREKIEDFVQNIAVPGYPCLDDLEVDIEGMNNCEKIDKHTYEVVLNGEFSVHTTDSIDGDDQCHTGGSFEINIILKHPGNREFLEVSSIKIIDIHDPFEDVS